MIIGGDEVKRIAKLARLNIGEDKYEMYSSELSKIVEVIDQLTKADTTGLDPVINVNNNVALFREDKVTDGNCDEDVLSNAPKSKFGYFLVPKVVE